MAERCYDTETAPGTVPDTGTALRRLAEICLEAHAIVAREGPDEVRLPLEDLLGRIGRHLGGGQDRAEDVADRA